MNAEWYQAKLQEQQATIKGYQLAIWREQRERRAAGIVAFFAGVAAGMLFTIGVTHVLSLP